MAQSREVEYWDRFDGGLNLTTQTQALSKNQTPDCVNVDFSLSGGFAVRGGFQTQANNALLSGARFIVDGYTNGDHVFIQGSDSSLLEWDGSTLTDTTNDVSDDDTERVRGVMWGNKLYMANGRLTSNIIMQSWDGTTLSTLGTSWDNNYSAPSGTNMPLARYIAEFSNHIFVADTVESGTRYPSRVRFSHLGTPTSWAENDWFYVGDTSDGDHVTSLLPFGDRLLVFKKNSVWMVSGYDRDTFTLERLSENSGTCTCGAIAANAAIAYWFSTSGQLMAYNGSSVTFLSQPIQYWSDIGKIKHGGSHRLMWSDGRLYMSLEAGDSEDVDRWLFIWDPATRSFTRYDRQPTDMIHWSKIGSDGDPLFLEPSDINLYRFDQDYQTDTDNVGTNRIDAYYRTSWLRAGETATKKRWKRPRVTAASTTEATMRVRVFYDFNDESYERQQEFPILAPEDASLWGTFTWGTDPWSAAADELYEFKRLPSSGSAYAISYEFSSPDSLGRWWVDSIAVPFRRKQVR